MKIFSKNYFENILTAGRLDEIILVTKKLGVFILIDSIYMIKSNKINTFLISHKIASTKDYVILGKLGFL